MGLIGKAIGFMRGLLGLTTSIQDVFHVAIGVSPLMLTKQSEWQAIIAGQAHWNKSDVPSLRLALSVATEIASRASTGLISEVLGSPRAEYINEQFESAMEKLDDISLSICSYGECIVKPFISENEIKISVVEIDSYWAIAYDSTDELIDVIFGAIYQTDKYIYRLLERHTYDREAKTHSIIYKAFRTESTAFAFTPSSLGQEVPLSEVPDWSSLQDITIGNVDKPLFVLVRMRNGESFEKPQRQGVPPWTKAIPMIQKADEHEARIEWEFEGGELALNVDVSMLKMRGVDNDGNPIVKLDKKRERLYNKFIGTVGKEFLPDIYNPEPRIKGYNQRMNDIFRRIEFLSGLSYGVISDATSQERTATEFRASKERLVTTVSGIQQEVLTPALTHLVYVFEKLSDLQGIPYGEVDLILEWSENYALDRKEEAEERMLLYQSGLLFLDEFRAYYNEMDLEDAQADLEERGVIYIGKPGTISDATLSDTDKQLAHAEMNRGQNQ